MCASPQLMVSPKTGLLVEVACRKCWQCVANRKNDWVGRCIAEEQTSAETTVVHLTYGGDDKVTGLQTDLGASILIYRDVQLWLKRLRKKGYPLRYFAVGEFGSLKGRCHWHIICFWEKGSPPFEDGKRNWNDQFWRRYPLDGSGTSEPIGFTMTESLRGGDAERAVRYVLKYLVKNLEDVQDGEDVTSQALVRQSRNPPLGAVFFQRRAADFVAQRLLPQDGLYSFRDIIGPDGLPRQFNLQGASLDYFMRELVRLWRHRYGEHPLDTHHSDFVQAWCDDQAPAASVGQLERRSFGGKPTVPVPEHYGAYYLWQSRNLYVADPVDGFRCLPRLFWSFDEEGYPAWHESVRTATEAESIRKSLRTSKDADAYRAGRDGR